MRKRRELRKKVLEFFGGSLFGVLFSLIVFHLTLSFFEPDSLIVEKSRSAQERECKAYQERLADSRSLEEFAHLRKQYIALCGGQR